MERIEFVPAHLVSFERGENLRAAICLLDLDTDFRRQIRGLSDLEPHRELPARNRIT